MIYKGAKKSVHKHFNAILPVLPVIRFSKDYYNSKDYFFQTPVRNYRPFGVLIIAFQIIFLSSVWNSFEKYKRGFWSMALFGWIANKTPGNPRLFHTVGGTFAGLSLIFRVEEFCLKFNRKSDMSKPTLILLFRLNLTQKSFVWR